MPHGLNLNLLVKENIFYDYFLVVFFQLVNNFLRQLPQIGKLLKRWDQNGGRQMHGFNRRDFADKLRWKRSVDYYKQLLKTLAWQSFSMEQREFGSKLINYSDREWCVCECSVVSDCLRPQGLQPARLLCPWDSPGKSTAVGAMPSSRGPSRPRDQTQVSCISCTGMQILCH